MISTRSRKAVEEMSQNELRCERNRAETMQRRDPAGHDAWQVLIDSLSARIITK